MGLCDTCSMCVHRKEMRRRVSNNITQSKRLKCKSTQQAYYMHMYSTPSLVNTSNNNNYVVSERLEHSNAHTHLPPLVWSSAQAAQMALSHPCTVLPPSRYTMCCAANLQVWCSGMKGGEMSRRDLYSHSVPTVSSNTISIHQIRITLPR